MFKRTSRTQRTLLLLALSIVTTLFAAQTAQAAITPIVSGSVKWGFKESFRSYIQGPIAHGSVTAGDGATFVDVTGTANDYVSFPIASGGFDGDTQNTSLTLTGSVHFYGHDGELDMTIDNLHVLLREGASILIASIESKDRDTGDIENYDNIVLAKIDLTGKTPDISAGTTTWTGLPTTLAAQGAPAFGDMYNAGTALDPLSITYSGPGGVPLPEAFTPPNTPLLGEGPEIEAGSGNLKAFYDAQYNVVHVLGSTELKTYDADTLALKASMILSEGETFWQLGNAFDPEHSIIFASLSPGIGSGIIFAIRYNDATGDYTTFDVNIPTARTVVYNSALDRVYSIATADSGSQDATVAAADRNSDTEIWEPRPAYSNISLGGSDAVFGVAATTDGQLVGTYTPTASGSGQDINLTRKPVFSLEDTGDSLTPTTIPGTQLSPATVPATANVSAGFQIFTPKPNGSMAVTEQNYYGASRQMLTLDPTDADPSGFTVNVVTLALPFQPKDIAFDATGDLYLAADDELRVYRNGEIFATAGPGAFVRGITGGSGKLYAFTGSTAPFDLSSWSITGYSPTITEQPSAANVTVGSHSETGEVTFESGGSGVPDPDIQWQERLSGSATWSDISGETDADLTFQAEAADDGNTYRAVYSNTAGEIATTSALLTVTVNDTVAPVVTLTSPVNGSTTSAESATVAYAVNDNDDTSPNCTIANGASVALKLGTNTITVTCVDDFGNTASASAAVTRTEAPPTGPPAPAAPKVANGKSVKLKFKQGKSVKVTVGTVTCASATTCVYTLPKSVKIKIGGKSYKVSVAGLKSLEPGKSQKITATVPAAAVKALKGKKSKITVPVQVANSAGVKHETAKNAIANLRG